MNMLNSCILEGYVISMEILKDRTVLIFGSERTYKNSEDKPEIQTSIFELHCFGQIAETAKKLKTNQMFRTCGRLSMVENRTVLICEHLEMSKNFHKEVTQ